MKKFKSRTVRAHELLPDDKFKMGGRMYIVTQSSPAYASDRWHISFEQLDNHFDRNGLLTNPRTKFKIYNKR